MGLVRVDSGAATRSTRNTPHTHRGRQSLFETTTVNTTVTSIGTVLDRPVTSGSTPDRGTASSARADGGRTSGRAPATSPLAPG